MKRQIPPPADDVFNPALLNSENSTSHIPVFTVAHAFVSISWHVLTSSVLKTIACQQTHGQHSEGAD